MDSRLEKSVRLIAWLALAATVATLLGMGVWLRPLAIPTDGGSSTGPASSEESNWMQLERLSAAPLATGPMEDER